MNHFVDALFRKRDSGIFREIPLNVPGRLFTSPMPSGAYDPGNRLLKAYEHHGIQHVFVLVTDSELQKKAKKDIFREYEKRGITYSRYTVEDLQAPSLESIKGLVCEAMERLKKKERVLVHCHAGVGRTSVTVSCITMAAERITAEEAISHVKENMMVNITGPQIRLIEKFGEIIKGINTLYFCPNASAV